MKKGLIFCVLIVFSVTVSAQNAREILDKAADIYNKAGGIKASFILDATDPNSKVTHSYDGTALLKGNKFRIDIPDATTWFDGTTQWVYMKDTEEVNITSPDEDELQGISPAYLFNIYKSGFDLLYKGEKKEGGKDMLIVEMIPQKKSSNMKKITVNIDKVTNMFSSIKIQDKSGVENVLRIVKFTSGVDLADSTFSFNKADYPGVHIEDLR